MVVVVVVVVVVIIIVVVILVILVVTIMIKGSKNNNSYNDMIEEGFEDDDDNDKQHYRCTKDDTIISISIKFGIPVSKLKRMNKSKLIGGDKIFPGMIIRLYDDNNSQSETPNSNIKSNSSSSSIKADSNPLDSIFKAISPLSNSISNGISSLSLMTPTTTSIPSSRSISNLLGLNDNNNNNSNNNNKNNKGHKVKDNGFTDDNIDHEYLAKELAHLKYDNTTGPFDEVDSLEPAPRDLNDYNSSGPQLIGLGKILTLDYARQLRNYLPRMLQIENISLLYSMLNDGSDLTSFYRNTKCSQYSILIVETTKGGIFGGFTSVPWKISTKYYGTGECFLFKVDNGKVIHYPWTLQNDFFMYSSADQLAMGGGNDGFGFIIDKDFITGSTHPCTTFNNPSLTNEEGTSFKILNAECWGFQSFISRKGRISPR